MIGAGKMREIRLASVWVTGVTIVASIGFAFAAAADDPIPPAGLIEVASNACLLAKLGHGQPCPEPQLPDGGNLRQLVAARLSRALFFIETYELNKALSEADTALALDQGNVAARHLVARLAMSTGDWARAERELLVAMREAPDDVNLRATNAIRLQLQPARREALRELNAILAQHPEHAFSREARARLLLSTRRANVAIADLDVLLADDNPKPILWSLRAAAYLQMNEPQRAIADFTKAMEDHPGQFDLLSGRLAAYELAGDDTAALRDLDTILGPIDGVPNYALGGDELAKYRTARAFLLVRLKRFADATTEMANALNASGRTALLRAQIFLRNNGFPETQLDGRDSDSLRSRLQACFGLNSCFTRISEGL
jgi:tetratricopeptide (TPR) repeat protein